MSTCRRKQFLRRLIEEGDRVFRTAWEQSIIFNEIVSDFNYPMAKNQFSERR
jgi:hypothetical protein